MQKSKTNNLLELQKMKQKRQTD